MSIDEKRRNPADSEEQSIDRPARKRIPLSVPRQKLEVHPIPGYHLHWVADRPGRVSQAQEAGYEFVSPEEVSINLNSVGNDSSLSGNSDLGTRVSVIGGAGEDGSGQRLYLMKLREAWWQEDQKVSEARNDAVVDSLRRGLAGAEKEGADAKHRYVPTSGDNRNIFQKRRP